MSDLHEAEYYEIIDPELQQIRCNLCPHYCEINPGESGKCIARKNIDGTLYSLSYGYTDVSIDHIEKQHAYHFIPNSRTQTFSTLFCNLDCSYCPVTDKTKADPDNPLGRKYPPATAAMIAKASGSRVLCFGDSEPLISFEWVRDTAKAAKANGMKIFLRTNGFFTEEPIIELIEYLDGVMIELKAVDKEGYQRICKGGDFEHIKQIIKLFHENEIHIELGIVIHEELGVGIEDVEILAKWMSNELSKEIPLHIMRLLPTYRVSSLLPTANEYLEEAREKALEEGLDYVYVDNISNSDSMHTYCPNCNTRLIKRQEMSTDVEWVSLHGHCNKCQYELYITMS